MLYKRNNRIYPIITLLLLLCLLFISCGKNPKQDPPAPEPHPQTISQKTLLHGGVEYWTRITDDQEKPWFWQQIENLAGVVFGTSKELPFSNSTAFLVGVGTYEHLRPQLDFVENDLEAMRKYLLDMGGFDEVYVAKNEVVTAALIKEYMQMKFQSLDKNSRLLFYYSGHGNDFGGGTGYMQFSLAEKDNSVSHVLEIDICEKWSRMLDVKHILFIFDCCVSGLAFTPKGTVDSRIKLAETLSGNGSRIVLTAGTAEQESFGIAGQSVFTRALLSALESNRYQNDGFLTVDQVYGELQTRVGEFTVGSGREMTPRIWKIPVPGRDYRGTFVFIDPGIKEKDFVAANQKSLDIISKGDDVTITITRNFGTLSVVVKSGGLLYLGDKQMAKVPQASTAALENVPAGEYTVTMQYEDGEKEARRVVVEKDKTVRVQFQYVPEKQDKDDVMVIMDDPDETASEMVIPDWLVLVEGGSFAMGSESGDDDEKPVHTVKVDSFYISRYEVTQKEYLEFCNETKANYPEWLEAGNEYNINTGTNDLYKKVAGPGKEEHPIAGISWYDAAAYCNWLSRKEGLTPCYKGSGDDITCDFKADGYRLPTEAEWEYAARGGKKSKGFKYSGSDNVDEVAWYYKNSGGTTHAVAQKKANELGLYDMSGNVWEWCWDWYGSYTGKSSVNPSGPGIGGYRVVRGGGWIFDAWGARSACRGRGGPSNRNGGAGFRLARGH